MSNVVTGGVQWNFFNDNFGNYQGASPLPASLPSPSSGRAEGRCDENPGKILRVNSMYWTDLLLAWLSSIVWKFVLRSSHSPGTRLKRLKLSVSILGGSYSHLCRYFKSSKKMDIAIWIFALTSRAFAHREFTYVTGIIDCRNLAVGIKRRSILNCAICPLQTYKSQNYLLCVQSFSILTVFYVFAVMLILVVL